MYVKIRDMIIQSANNPVESQGLIDSGVFTIKTTAAAFELLSSGLYSNKIRAVIRELSCNATDAHTMVNATDKPIEIKLPNTLDSQFYVKDFGPGLSHDHVMRLYTTYFESTKQQSDDFIGGFGIGSKSPFSYTQAFTVESRFDGKKKIYTAYLEDGVPKIAHLGETDLDPDESTGLTISMPVEPNDFSAFRREAEVIFQFFDVPPIIKGAELNFNKYARPFPKVMPTNMSGMFIRTGQITYPVDLDKMKPSDKQELQDTFSLLRYYSPVLTLPVGSVSIAASRENLAYDDKTIKELKKHIPLLVKEFFQDAVTQLEAQDLSTVAGRQEVTKILQKYRLSLNRFQAGTFQQNHSDKVFAEFGIDPKKYNLSLLDEPSKLPHYQEISKVLDLKMPMARDPVRQWADHYRGVSAMDNVPSIILQDMDPASTFADKARRAWIAKEGNSYSNVLALIPKQGSTEQEVQHAIDLLFNDWGFGPNDRPAVHALSNHLNPTDALKYKKSATTNSVEAFTFFSGRDTICHNDNKKCYYVLCDVSREIETPNFPDDSVWKGKEKEYEKLMSEIQSNTQIGKEFLLNLGADQGALSRVYLINKQHEDALKDFPNLKPLYSVIEEGLSSVEFQKHWNALPVITEKKRWRDVHMFASYIEQKKHENPQAFQQFQSTQVGQLLTWIKTLPSYTVEDDVRPNDAQYRMLGRYASKALPHIPLETKVYTAKSLVNLLSQYYPMIDTSTTYPVEKHRELIEYIGWRDNTRPTPLLEGVTKKPTLETTLSLEENYEN